MNPTTDTNEIEIAGIKPVGPQESEIQEALGRGYAKRESRQKIAERRVDQGVSAFLEELPCCWYIKTHGAAMQTMGIPDFIGVYRGTFFGFEDKPPDPTRRARTLQRVIGRKILRAGGVWGVVRSPVEAAGLLQPILDRELALAALASDVQSLKHKLADH